MGKPMSRQRTQEERAKVAARILELSKEEPPLTIAVIAQRVGCGHNLVHEVRREARERR